MRRSVDIEPCQEFCHLMVVWLNKEMANSRLLSYHCICAFIMPLFEQYWDQHLGISHLLDTACIPCNRASVSLQTESGHAPCMGSWRTVHRGFCSGNTIKKEGLKEAQSFLLRRSRMLGSHSLLTQNGQICVQTPESLSDSCASVEQASRANAMSKGRGFDARPIIVQVHTS